MNPIRAFLASALVLAAMIWGACSNSSGNTVVYGDSAKKKTFPVTVTQFKEIKKANVNNENNMTIPLGFLDGKEDIPYFIVSAENLDATLACEARDWRSYKISDITESSTSVTITNEKTNSKAVFDLSAHTCAFDNYDAFFQSSNVYMNAVGSMMDYIRYADYGNVISYSNVPGQPIKLDWSTQDIGVILAKVDGKCYLAMPLQSYTDIFSTGLAWNGKDIFYAANLIDNIGVDAFYNDSPIQIGNRSAALAEFCYNELCINLDFNYGLKAIHGIEAFPDFDHYFAAAGIKDDLKSPDPLKFATALKEVCEFYFGDGHSNYWWNSPYLGKTKEIPAIHLGSATEKQYRNEEYGNLRKAKFGQGTVPAYEVVDDTAIVRFDQFTSTEKDAAAQRTSRDALLANNCELLNKYVGNLENTYETIAMISAVNQKIKADANIKNVVLDLSCNGGGANRAACFVIAWMLGYCKFDFRNPITGAKWSSTYQVDVNLDGTYNAADDSIKDKNLFCIVSPNSFSCGNMTPAVLKASDRVTILGAPSSGGTSCVYFTCAADGTIFRFSSRNVMSIVKNGSYYDIDQGVEPHYYINIPANFYEKDEIKAIVASVNKKRSS